MNYWMTTVFVEQPKPEFAKYLWGVYVTWVLKQLLHGYIIACKDQLYGGREDQNEGKNFCWFK